MTAPSFVVILLVAILCHFVLVILGNFVFVILSNFVLENVGGQSAQGKDSSTVPLALETLSKAVESLEAKIESQTDALSYSRAKLDMQVFHLNNKLDVQGRLLRNLEALVKKEENVKELMAKEAWEEPIAYSPTNPIIIAPEGDDVEMLCVVHEIPLPEIRWARENGGLQSHLEFEKDGKVLRVKNIRFSDEGSYVCVAANGVRTLVTQAVRLEIYDPLSSECHRIIESNKGNLTIKSLSSGCLWLIKLPTTTGFRLDLDPLMTEPISLIGEPYSYISDNPSIQLCGSEYTPRVFTGKSVAIVVPPGRKRTTLSWTGLKVDDSIVSSSTKFVNGMEGTLEWESQRDGTDKIFWAIDLESNGELNWTLSTAWTLAMDHESPCQVIAFSILQIRPNGTISHIQRTCNGSLEGSLTLDISSQILVRLHMKTFSTSRSKLRVSWTHHDEPLEKNLDGIVAGTIDGAFVVPFNSEQTKEVASGSITGLTFDWDSRRIYYLKSGVGIMRSNLNGNESEILLSARRFFSRGMTIEPASGNLYYGDQASRTIRVCDNDGKKCSTIVTSNALRDVHDVAVHLSKGLLFWSIWGGYLYRANLDGSDAIVLLEKGVEGLYVDEHEDRLYWSYYGGIGSCDMNGQDIRKLPITLWDASDVAIDKDKVYCGNGHDVLVTSKLGTNSTMLAKFRLDVNHIAFFGTRISNRPANPCAKAKCAHLCVLVTRWSYRCTCPDGKALNADGKTCQYLFDSSISLLDM